MLKLFNSFRITFGAKPAPSFPPFLITPTSLGDVKTKTSGSPLLTKALVLRDEICSPVVFLWWELQSNYSTIFPWCE